MQRLVLQGKRVDWQSFGLVRLNELGQIARVGGFPLCFQRSAGQRVVCLHPGRRTPRRSHQLQFRIERAGLLKSRNDVRLVVSDGKVLLKLVGAAGRIVVVRVKTRRREVGRPHGHAQVVNADARLRREKLPHQLVALRGCQFVLQQPGRRIGHRGAEAGNRLIRRCGNHADERAAGTGPGSNSRSVCCLSNWLLSPVVTHTSTATDLDAHSNQTAIA